MIERYSLATNKDKLLKRFQGKSIRGFQPIYNASPGLSLPVITNEHPDEISLFQWGLIPYDAKDSYVGSKLINARSETLKAKRPFADLIETKRCLVPADSFFTWHKGTHEQNYRIMLENESMFCIAGVWEKWQDEYDEFSSFSTFSIITVPANSEISKLSERAPAILSTAQESQWIDNDLSTEDALSIISNLKLPITKSYKVSDKIQDSKLNTADLITRLGQQNSGETLSLFD